MNSYVRGEKQKVREPSLWLCKNSAPGNGHKEKWERGQFTEGRKGIFKKKGVNRGVYPYSVC